MHNLIRFRYLFLTAGLLAGSAACSKDKTQRESDRAAERVLDRTADLKDEAKDLSATAADKRADVVDTAKDNAKDNVQEVRELAKDTREDIDDSVAKTAERANDLVEKTTERAKDLGENMTARKDELAREAADSAKAVADKAKDVGASAVRLKDATTAFLDQRMIRVHTLRAVHALAVDQAMMINALTQAYPLVDANRAKVVEKLNVFQMRIDEAGNAIEALQVVEPADWKARDAKATAAMKLLEAGREEAWQALHAAHRIDRTSMR